MAKKQSEKTLAAKARLRQRLRDIYLGSVGEPWDPDLSGPPNPEDFMRYAQALKAAFGVEADPKVPRTGNEYLWNLWNLHNYRDPDTATEYLFDRGVRA